MLAHDSKRSMLLQQPGQMGPLRLKNRVVMGPMGTNFGTTDGFSTERDKVYYAERARGGAAMIITEAMVVSGNARNHRASHCIFDDRRRRRCYQGQRHESRVSSLGQSRLDSKTPTLPSLTPQRTLALA